MKEFFNWRDSDGKIKVYHRDELIKKMLYDTGVPISRQEQERTEGENPGNREPMEARETETQANNPNTIFDLEKKHPQETSVT